MANNLIAPNGKPSNLSAEQYALVRTPEFKAWFGDWENDPQNASKVVDENGEPLVVYHGTDRKFTIFNKRLIGSSSGEENERNGFYFTSDYGTAKYYADYYNDQENYVMVCFLKLINPIIKSESTPSFIFSLIENAFEGGNDGVIIKRVEDSSRISDQIIAFEPTQIKLADGSNTTFDAANPDIRYADGGETSQDITCINCGWHWNTSDSDESDKYVCHKCGFDNKAFYDPEPIGVMADGGALRKSKVFYHGSNTLFENIKFLKSKSGESKHLGDGIYITNDINVAKKYGTYIYEIISEEPLKSLNYSSAVSREEMIEIIDIFKNSDDADLNYLATEYQDDLDDDDLLWGKQLIADLERNGVDVYNTLLYLGYNSIVSPINKLNDFFGFDDNSLNINVIKPNILHIISVKSENDKEGSYADGGEVGLTEIAQDVYISKDKDKLPKDATIVIHRYNDNIKAGELGLFAGNLEDMELDGGYGKNKAYISIGKNAKIKKIVSTERYLDKLGEFDKPREYLKKKYGKNSLFDLMDDAGSLDNPSDAWYETQKLAISKMREAGDDFEVLEMTYEEDYMPHQYLITTLKDKYLQFKKGGKVSASKTPAPKKDRVFGSEKNKVGSAASKESAKKINLSEDIITTLSNKAKEYNEENSGNKVTLNTLKAVMRRGMGAYSTSHRPTITGGAPNSRQAWGFARVNKFLKKKSGEKVKAAYVQDDDLLEMGGTINKNNLKMIQQHYHSMKPIEDIQVGDIYVIKEDMFAPHQDHEHPQHLSTRYATVEVKSPCHRNLDSYTLEVMDCDCDNAAGRYAKGKVIERSRKHILSSGKLKSAVAKATEFKDGGELNADSQEVKEYFAHDSGNAGGLLVGKRHSEGGIKADVKSTGQQIEMEGGEAVITRGAVNSKKKYVYEGKEMTTREILSDLNVKGGGVAFADGGDVPEKMNCGCSSMKVGGISYTPQDFITLSEKEYQEHRLIDGIEKERKDHFYTLAKLNSGAISIEQALREIATKEMMIDPKYPYSE